MQELEVVAKIDNVHVLTDFVDGVLESNDCPMKAQLQIDVALDEIVSNVVYYAYDDREGNIKVGVEAEPGKGVKILFSDSGKPYNPLEKEDPDVTQSAEERKIGGLGIFIVKKTMDDVLYKYENGHNILTIIKNF